MIVAALGELLRFPAVLFEALLVGCVAMLWWNGVRARTLLVKHEEKAWQEQREKQMLVQFLHNLTRNIDAARNRDALYPSIVQAAIRGTGARSACIFERDADGSFRRVASSGIFPPLQALPEHLRRTDALRADLLSHAMRAATYRAGESILDDVAADGKGRFYADAAKEKRVPHIVDPTLRARSLILAPLFSGKELVGVLAVANPEADRLFDVADFAYAKSIAGQASVALHLLELFRIREEKARLDIDLSVASGVQQMLLPQGLPKIAGADMMACYRPAKLVGGDLYALKELGDGMLGVLVADVSGKGIPASLVMAMAHTHLRHLLRVCDSPADLLRRLNADMIGEIRSGMYITIACALVDINAGRISVARAGHELPLLVHGDGRVEKIETEGMAIGMVPPEIFDAVITETTLPFPPGASLVFYTDGVTEARNPDGDEFGSERLEQIARLTRRLDAAEMNREIILTLETFCAGVQPHDDLTLVTVKRTVC